MVPRDQHVEDVHPAVAVVVEAEIDRRLVEEVPLIVSGSQHVEGVDLGVGGRIAGLADSIAEVEDIRLGQSRVVVGQDGDLEPLPLDRVVGP